MPRGAIVVGFDVIGRRPVGLGPVKQALATLAREVDTWLPFQQAQGDEIWGIVIDADALLRALRVMLVDSERFRCGLGLGYVEVNSAYYPHGYGYGLANAALNKQAKKSGKIEVGSASRFRRVADEMRQELNLLVEAWRRGEDPDTTPALRAVRAAIDAAYDYRA